MEAAVSVRDEAGQRLLEIGLLDVVQRKKPRA
jgi:hypothetical protein